MLSTYADAEWLPPVTSWVATADFVFGKSDFSTETPQLD